MIPITAGVLRISRKSRSGSGGSDVHDPPESAFTMDRNTHTLAKDGQQITLRTPAAGTIGALFKAAGIALPPNIRDAAAG